MIDFALANEESREESQRVQEGWRERFNRLGEEKVTARAPAWPRLRPDRKKFDLVPEAAADVRRIFRMAEDSYGNKSITCTLSAERVKSIR